MDVKKYFSDLEKTSGIKFHQNFHSEIENIFSIISLNKNKYLNFSIIQPENFHDFLSNFKKNELLPFMVEIQSQGIDYYCFKSDNSHSPGMISVYSDDAVVHNWANVDDFIHWLNSLQNIED
ncbi:hypothetical protein V8J88_10965 [Massilia sp. W12]|uniref:hypothetical protein n=1 Tax=Massilia sp. W12 TaxID=3126507 RepID=UPI0030CF5296